MSNYPKIGIRPTIDARPVCRDSLEEQTMGMAIAVKELFESTLKNADGSAVECVISDTTIGRVAEAAACEEKFTRENVGVSLTVTPCWCYGLETLDMDPFRPKAVYGFNGTERPGAVYLACALAGYSHKGLPAFSIYGHDVKDATDKEIPEDVAQKLILFAKAGLAVANMRGKSYLSIGGVAMGIAGSIVKDDFFSDYLGMRNEYIDMVEIDRRINKGIYDHDEYEKAIKWVREHCQEGPDYNDPAAIHSREQKDAEWEYCVKMIIVAKDLMHGNPKLKEMGYFEESLGHNALAAGFQGQRQWTDYLPNGDVMESFLCSSFDWNGAREPYIMATENDCLNGVSMLFGKLLTNTAQVFCDVRTYWSPDSVKRVTGYELEGAAANGIIHLINSGAAAIDGCGEQEIDGKPAMKHFWDITEEEIEKCMKATTWGPANLPYFRGGGFSSTFKTRGGMPMTMVRVNYIKGLGPVLQFAEGYSVELPDEVFDIINKRTDPTWPTTFFAPIVNNCDAFKDVYSVMANWGANHCALSYGHIGAELITLASMLRIPVCMHNVSEDRIFRPSAWASFGTKDKEGADFRACANFGSIYG
ncbi:MAG: L-fucose isomerase [Clostridiales bacterium]|nr:L-fucose isomerase [Clostridiales bacterium]